MKRIYGLEEDSIKREKVSFALVLTAAEVAMLFGFILIGVISPATMAAPVAEGATVTWGFAYGIVIVIVSVLLTGLYVWVENRSSV